MIATTEEQGMQAWARLIASAFDTESHQVNVIFANQSGPRPCKPYVTITQISQPRQGRTIFKYTDTYLPETDEYECVMTVHWRGTFQVTVFGDYHRQIIETMSSSLKRPDVQELLMPFGVYPVRVMGLNSINEPLSDSWEHRSQGDFEIAFAKRYTGSYKDLREIVITGNFGSVDADLTVEVE